jgi:hypothetical protein
LIKIIKKDDFYQKFCPLMAKDGKNRCLIDKLNRNSNFYQLCRKNRDFSDKIDKNRHQSNLWIKNSNFYQL